MRKILLIFFIYSFYSCEKPVEVITPDLHWDLFESPGAIPLSHSAVLSLEGVYRVTNGSEIFGDKIVVKTSYVIENSDTTFHVSLLSGKDITWIICNAKSLDSSILIYGNWRRMITTETGTARFRISNENGARQILSATPVVGKDSITIDGIFGDGDNIPERKITLIYDRPLHNRNGFQIMAHRAGGRTSDHLNVSENSVEMIKKTAAFGSTGVEIDIRLTSDRVPVLYHDNTVNDRLVQPNGMTGPIENYSYTQLSHLARLINGEKIPTLREALDAVVFNTDLEYVWLDTKYSGDMSLVRQIQEEYLQKAAAAGRNLQILIGLPGDDQLNDFKELADYSNIPSLCELTRDNVREINAKVWAPRWTLGTQDDEVAGVHAEGRKAFTWTLDVPDYISLFVNNGSFDGILSNYPTAVAYYEYVK